MGFFLWFVYLHHDHYTCCQHPNVFVRVVPNYCKFIRSCWLRLRIFFLYICSVLDCYLLCGVFFFFFLCEQNCFQSNLNPKEFYFNVNFFFFLTVFVLHWLKISVVCCLQFQFNCWNTYLFFDTWQRVLVVRLWKPHKPERYSVFCFVLGFFFLVFFVVLPVLLWSFVFVCSRRKVWNVQYRKLQSMQAKNCGTLFSVYGICKCTGRNNLYFSNVLSLIWGKTVLQRPESLLTMQICLFMLHGWHMLSGTFMPSIHEAQKLNYV